MWNGEWIFVTQRQTMLQTDDVMVIREGLSRNPSVLRL